MRITQITRTAKSAKAKLAVTLLGALTVLGASSVLGAPKPSFSVSVAPASQTVTAGQDALYTVAIKRQNKHAGAVDLSVSGLPDGATGTFVPDPVPGSGTSSSLAVKTDAEDTPAGTYTVKVEGISGSITSSSTAKLVVVSQAQPSFSLAATPAQSVISADDTTSHQLAISRSGGFEDAVALSASGLPAGVAAVFGSNPAAGSSTTLDFISDHNPKTGTYTVTITGTGFAPNEITSSTSVVLTVEEKKPFQISGNPTDTLAPGKPVPLNLTLTNPHNFALNVTEVAVDVDRLTSEPGCDGEQNYSVEPIPAARAAATPWSSPPTPRRL